MLGRRVFLFVLLMLMTLLPVRAQEGYRLHKPDVKDVLRAIPLTADYSSL